MRGSTGWTYFAGHIEDASGTTGLRVASLLGPGCGGVNGSGALATVELLIAATGGRAIGLSDVLLVDSCEALPEAMTRDGIVNVRSVSNNLGDSIT